MVRHTLKILQQMLQDFYSVSNRFGTLCIKGLSSLVLTLINWDHINKALTIVNNTRKFYEALIFVDSFEVAGIKN